MWSLLYCRGSEFTHCEENPDGIRQAKVISDAEICSRGLWTWTNNELISFWDPVPSHQWAACCFSRAALPSLTPHCWCWFMAPSELHNVHSCWLAHERWLIVRVVCELVSGRLVASFGMWSYWTDVVPVHVAERTQRNLTQNAQNDESFKKRLRLLLMVWVDFWVKKLQLRKRIYALFLSVSQQQVLFIISL